MKTKKSTNALLCALSLLGTVGTTAICHAEESWKSVLNRQVPQMGYQNWIVIADAAYPWQASPGVETISTGAEPLVVLKAVTEALGKAKNVRPLIYTDSELQFISEKDAPTITAYRDELGKIVGPEVQQYLPHQQLIQSVATAGQNYRVLVLKTKGTLPYSSVFMQLNSAYWNADAEQRLRATMMAEVTKTAAAAAPVPTVTPGGGPSFGPPGAGFGFGGPNPQFRGRGQRGR